MQCTGKRNGYRAGLCVKQKTPVRQENDLTMKLYCPWFSVGFCFLTCLLDMSVSGCVGGIIALLKNPFMC